MAALPRPTLLWKYAALLAAVVCVPLAISGAVSGRAVWREAVRGIESLQRAEALAAALQIESSMQRLREALRASLQKFEAADTPHEGLLRIEFASLLRHYPEIGDLAWRGRTDGTQAVLSRYGPGGPPPGHAIVVEAARRAAPESPWVVGEVYFRKGSEPYVAVAVAAPGGDSVLSAEINLTLVREVVSQPEPGSGRATYVADAGGQLIAHTDLALVLARTDMTRLPQMRRMLDAAAPASTVVDGALDEQGTPVVSAAVRLREVPWIVFAEQPLAQALQPVHAVVARTLALVGVGVAVALVASFVLARRMVRPLREIEAGARELAAGRYDQRIAWRSADELGALADQFNRMATQLQETLASQERRIAERTQELAQANEAKTRFLAAASHDLRQPIHALTLFAGQLRASRLRGSSAVLAQSIEASVQALEALVNSLLDLSQLDVGAVRVSPRAFAAQELLSRLNRQFAPAAAAKGLRLRFARTSLWLRSDPLLLERILLNLLGNSLRYTSRGSILVGCRRRGERVELIVADTGIGIGAEHLSRIFEEFYRVAPAAEGAGLGLGLAIVRRLAQLLGHSVAVESTSGRGTVVRVLIARARPQPSPEEPAAVPATVPALDPLRAKHVLVIDDDAAARDAMRGLLTQWRCVVQTAADGDEATALARQGRPDVVLCDLNLAGGRSGIDVLKQLREACGPGLRCAFVTGEASTDLIAQARGTGYPVAFKPTAPAKLRAMMEHLVQAP